MNKLKFIIVSNPFKDQEHSKYDYIGQFVTNGTKTLADSAETIVVGRTHIDAAFMQLVVGLLFEVIAEEVADNYRCTVGGIAFANAIAGSFPSANSPFSDDNELYVAVTVGDPIRSTVAALVPEKDTEESVKVAISNVEDKASHEIGVIHGTATAIVTGKNMSATLAGESIVLADVDTLVTESVGTVVAQDGLGQRLDVNFATPIEAGKYWLLLKTRGYTTPDAEPETYRKKVTVNPGAEPEPETTITKVTSSAGENIVKVGQSLTVEGTGFGSVVKIGVQFATTGGSYDSVETVCTLEGTTKASIAAVPTLTNLDATQGVEVNVIDADGNVLAYVEDLTVQV